MFHLRETNPHFQSRQPPNPQTQPSQPPDGPERRRISTRPRRQSQPHDATDHRTSARPPPQSQPHDGSDHHIPTQHPPIITPPTHQHLPQSQPHDWSDHHIPTQHPPMVILPPRQPLPHSEPHDWSDHHIPTQHPPMVILPPRQPQSQPHDLSDHHIPTQHQPMVILPPRPKTGNRPQSPPRRAPRQSRPPPPPEHTDPEFHPSSLIVPPPRKTKHITWLVATFCIVFWVIVILGGLILLVIYVAYRPRLPKFDLSSATLNAAYLDMGYLLNADMNLLTNFTNPNKKVNVDFNNIVINLYFEGAHIASRYVRPFKVANKEYTISNVHMVTSQVAFSKRLSQHMAKQIERGRIVFEIKSYLRTKSRLGSFMKYSYWLYGHCNFVVGAPPGGVMLAKKCVTKR